MLGANVSVADFTDNFEDGVIDTSLWVIGGAKRGPYQSSPTGVGNWTYSHNEIVDSDGYLKMRVEGPTSGISYGAEAWVRTKHDYNDGQSYLLNFTWEAEVDSRATQYQIQITDGYIPDPGAHTWSYHEVAGTADLLWCTPSDRCLVVPPGTTQTYSWSITINPNGVARLYDDIGGTGALLYENDALDQAKPWHVRFMVACATSTGFPAGDSRLNLYDFSSVSITPPPIPVEIDIKPGSWPNTINLGSNGVIPVAILTTETFDATSVNPSTVQLEGLGVAVRGKSEKLLANEEDVDEDGDIDLVMKIETENLEPGAWQSGPIVLTGETYDGQAIEGWDDIIIVPPEE